MLKYVELNDKCISKEFELNMPETPENKNVIANKEIDLIEVFRKIWDGRKTIFKWMGIFFVIGNENVKFIIN